VNSETNKRQRIHITAQNFAYSYRRSLRYGESQLATLASLCSSHSILVISDWHTMRARSIFHYRLPQYHWSVADAKDPRLFGVHWWHRREWAKITFNEWLKVIWWNTVDRWR
jgi:hypothetical protein